MGLVIPRRAYSATMLVAVLAEDQADRGRVGLVAELVVDDAQVEVHLAGVLGLELALLQVDDDEARSFRW